MKRNTLSQVQNVGMTDLQKVETASKHFSLNRQEKAVLAVLMGVGALTSNANAADGSFTLDIASIISGIATLVTLVTSVGLAFLSVVLVIKAFKYIKSAM